MIMKKIFAIIILLLFLATVGVMIATSYPTQELGRVGFIYLTAIVIILFLATLKGMRGAFFSR